MIAAIREWAARHTAERRYSPVGQLFHWTMALLISFQLYWGWAMGRLPAGGDKWQAYSLHAELGLAMLLLAALRAVWRLAVPGPINDADRLGWQTWAAHVTHILFYVCFFGLPLSGWAMWSALGEAPPLEVAGIAPWPHMPFDAVPVSLQWWILDWAEGLHAFLVILLVAMLPLHVGAALKHHFWDRHDVLRGMLPELPEDADQEEPRHGLPRRESRPPKGAAR
jgi:cytochrome b561